MNAHFISTNRFDVLRPSVDAAESIPASNDTRGIVNDSERHVSTTATGQGPAHIPERSALARLLKRQELREHANTRFSSDSNESEPSSPDSSDSDATRKRKKKKKKAYREKIKLRKLEQQHDADRRNHLLITELLISVSSINLSVSLTNTYVPVIFEPTRGFEECSSTCEAALANSMLIAYKWTRRNGRSSVSSSRYTSIHSLQVTSLSYRKKIVDCKQNGRTLKAWLRELRDMAGIIGDVTDRQMSVYMWEGADRYLAGKWAEAGFNPEVCSPAQLEEAGERYEAAENVRRQTQRPDGIQHNRNNQDRLGFTHRPQYPSQLL